MHSNRSKISPAYKNLMCASLGLLIIFVTSIFVCEDFFNQNINTLIQTATLLKDYQYSNWGQQPNQKKSIYTHTIMPYDRKDNKSPAQKENEIEPIDFDYNFQYKNISFSQGNSGYIKFINAWERKIQAPEKLKDKKIKTINFGAQKVFSNDFYATQTRRFVIMHNILTQTIKNQFLKKFYAEYLHNYYFKDMKLVQKTIYDLIGIDQKLGEQIYKDSAYGWDSSEKLAKWLELNFAGKISQINHFENIQLKLGLTSDQIIKMAGESSMMNNLVSALNGTIRAKVTSGKIFNFENGCNPFCSSDQLLAIQMSTGFLTNEPIFASLSLGKLSNVFNSTFSKQIEYLSFCNLHPELKCIDNKTVISFFLKNMLNNFTVMTEAFRNRDKFNIIESIFQLQEPQNEYFYGQSVIKYVLYLYDNIYNVVGEQSVDYQAYQFMFTNYNHLGKIIEDFKNILHLQFYTRAFFFQNNATKCELYFQNQYKDYVSLCSDDKTNPIKSLDGARYYMQAYFYQNRAVFSNQTKMNVLTSSSFLKTDIKNSLFARTVGQLISNLGVAYGCQDQICSPEELLEREWRGQNPILSNLLPDFFPEKTVSITNWDAKFVLKGVEPQFNKMTGKILTKEQSKSYLNSQNGISNLFNMMKLRHSAQTDDAKILLFYIQKIVLDIGFGGAFLEKDLADLVNGYISEEVAYKKEGIHSTIGGSPWLNSKVQMLETNHVTKYFNTINSGIFQKGKLKSYSTIQGNSKSSSYYQVFKNQYEDVEEILQTPKKISGTNLLGFHQDIQSFQKLQAYLDFAHKTAILTHVSTSSDKGFDANKYTFDETDTYLSIGIEQQNQNWVKINPNSQIFVEPVTGLTISLKIQYTVFAKLFYLDFYTTNGQSSYIPLYENTIKYERINLSEIRQINDTKNQLKTFYMTTVILSAVSMLLVVVSGGLYCWKKRKTTKASIIDSLMKQQDEATDERIIQT